MSDESKSVEPQPPKARTRRERGKPVYAPPYPTVEEIPTEDKPKKVTDPNLGETDVHAEIHVVLRTRYGEVLDRRESNNLPGLLNPANRGVMAQVVSNLFSGMRDLVVQGFSQLMDEKPKKAAQQTPRSLMAPRSFKLPDAPIDADEVEAEAKPPLPTPPGSVPRPPLSPP